jgi:hypothetical protein
MVFVNIPATRGETTDERVLRIIKPEMAGLKECYLRSAAVYAKSTCEAAAVIADAVLAKCASEEKRLAMVLDAAFPSGKGKFNNAYLRGVRDGGRPIILKTVLDVRAEFGICSPNH